MCTNQRYIYNRYSRRRILVPCGHCESCLQEKALARSVRIRNNVSFGTMCLFVTLTYRNDYVPYVKRSDLSLPDSELTIYRNSTCRYKFSRHHGYSFYKDDTIDIVDTIPVDKSQLFDSDNQKLRHLTGLSHDCIGVLYYPDLQRFFKRLRQVLKRNFKYEKSFSMYACSEYGGHTQRPHFHTLIFCPIGDEAIFRDAILTAWPYSDKRRAQDWVEVARDAATYVSSYVNSNTNLLPLLSLPDTKPSHSASKGFGVVLDCFKLGKILQKIDSGDLHYYTQKKFDGQCSTVPVSIPQYVLSRYFPKFKGFGWLTPSQLLQLCLDPSCAGFLFRDFTFSFQQRFDGKPYSVYVESKPKLINPCYHYSPQETYAIYVRIENCYRKFHEETGLGRYDYYYYYHRVWSALSLSHIKDKLLEVEIVDDWCDFYENSLMVDYIPGIAPSLSDFDLQKDPNKRKDIVESTHHFKFLYDKLDKQKKVSNYCMSHVGMDV